MPLLPPPAPVCPPERVATARVEAKADVAPLERALPADLQEAYRATLRAQNRAYRPPRATDDAGRPLPVGAPWPRDAHWCPGGFVPITPEPGPSLLIDTAARPNPAYQAADGLFLDALQRLGLLAARPANTATWAESSSDWSPDNTQRITITASVNPGGFYAPRAIDPVAARWLVVAHEIGHGDLARQRRPFAMPGWTDAQNAAVNDLLFDLPPAQWWETSDASGRREEGIFNETYADVFGLLLVEKATGAPAALRPAVRSFAATRWTDQRARDRRVVGTGSLPEGADEAASDANSSAWTTSVTIDTAVPWDDHRTVDGLAFALQALDEGRWIPRVMTMDDIRSAARQAASRAVVAYWDTPEARAHNGWHQDTADVATHRALARAAARDEQERNPACRPPAPPLVAPASNADCAQVGPLSAAGFDTEQRAAGAPPSEPKHGAAGAPPSEQKLRADSARGAHPSEQTAPTVASSATALIAAALDAAAPARRVQETAARTWLFQWSADRSAPTAAPSN